MTKGFVGVQVQIRRLLCVFGSLAVVTILAHISVAPVALPRMEANTQRQSTRLTVQERIAWQRKIEQVLWNHRMWPKENPAPKPRLEEVMPESAIRQKVERYLKASNALAAVFHEPMTAQQLQSEMNRMARQSQNPALLRELFAALNHDPLVIAECLARPTLAEPELQKEVAGISDGSVPAETSLRSASGGTSLVAISEFEAWWQQHEAALPVELALPATLYQLPEAEAQTASSAEQTGGGQWVPSKAEKPTDVPEGRTRHQTVWTGTEMIVWGGEGESNLVRNGSRYDPVTDSWLALNQVNAPAQQENCTALWTGEEMIVWGGKSTATGEYTNSGGRYHPLTDTWVSLSTFNAPVARGFHSAVWTGSEMLVWGGADQLGNALNTGGRYNPATDSWASMSTFYAPSERALHTAVWTGTEMLIWGGENRVASRPMAFLQTGARYHPPTDSWKTIEIGQAPLARKLHSVVWTGQEMLVWGGVGLARPTTTLTYPNELDSGGRYDPWQDRWEPLSMLYAPTPRASHTAIWTGREMIVWGGDRFDFESFQNGGRYDPETDSWGRVSNLNAPPGRTAHSAIWTGTEMIIWGGTILQYYPGGTLRRYQTNSGGRYNPETDSWSSTKLAGLPPYLGGTVVWTGVEMIFWGGSGETGARYQPATDSWTQTSLVFAPSSLDGSTSIWTGTEMIIYGGGINRGPLGYVTIGGGAKYNPMTDTWSGLGWKGNTSPGPRSGHVAVWSGTEMLVWGGFYADEEEDFYYTDGVRYNPVTQTWARMSSQGGPRAGAIRAVWAGTEMIVLGWYDDKKQGPNWKRYNPVTDTWRSVAPNDSFFERSGYSVLWTGTEMILWGGEARIDGKYVLVDTGSRYQPELNEWKPISTGNAPSARNTPRLIWTGLEMIVWGGYEPAWKPLNTGARYNPQTDSWQTMSLIKVPEPRPYYAVWTGTEMIVWSSGARPRTGGRYIPPFVPNP